MSATAWLRRLGRLRLAAVVCLVLAGSVGGAFVLGVVGVPAVETVENRFTGVSEDTTTVGTGMTVSNPNPIGVQFGGTEIAYTVSMNDVAIASGAREGLELHRGNTTLQFDTRMRNAGIPAWWGTHVENGETTRVVIDADVSHSVLGERAVSITQNRTVETDILGQFNATETRPVEADRPLVADPVVYVNATRGSWDRANLTRSATPMDLEFDVYNPKVTPYTITTVGYDIRMNGIRVGSGRTDRGYVVAPEERETVGVRTVIENDRLDQWWVSHLRRNQHTTMEIAFYLVVEAAGEQFRIDLDTLDYEQRIETDMFDNKEQYPTGGEDRADGSGSSATPADGESTPGPGTERPTDDGSGVDTPTDDGGLVGL